MTNVEEEDDSYHIDNELETVGTFENSGHQSQNQGNDILSAESSNNVLEKCEDNLQIKTSTNADIAEEKITIKTFQNSEEENVTWETCAGQLNLLTNEVKECDFLLDKIKTDTFPNPILFLINTIEIVKSIQIIADSFIKNASGILTRKTKNEVTDILYDQTDFNKLIDHDPGRRGQVLSSSQRQYLISLGPHQPRLASYPRNE